MASDSKNGSSGQSGGLGSRNALILKIALHLNYLSKKNHQKLLQDLQLHKNRSEIDILKLMRVKNYTSQANILKLKRTCFDFVRTQQDIRFGSLCTNFEFLTQSNLNLALEEQKKLAEEGRNIMLGALLVDAGMLSDKQRNLVLHKQRLEKTTRKNTQPYEITDEASGEHEASEETPGFDKRRMREIKEAEILILIQDDLLKAYISKTNNFKNSIFVSDLKSLLEKNGIIYGLVDDQSLEAFIKEEKYKTSFFKIAEGLEPIAGKDAKIFYMFDQDYLKPGRLAEDGTIDFKERGEIPFVSAGDILAEKIPLKEGRDGVSIYGDDIPKGAAEDISFVLGKGARVSKDGLRVISDVNGNPKVNSFGEISVNDSYFIEGDVDYTTGHIKFDKTVYITGSIKSGFRVEAIDVVAKAVDGGFVKAQGDVFVQNGATESVIEAKGNIKAGFLHRSKAACMGNMTVVKEIVDTEILVEGTFEMNRGRVYASSIMAKGGAKIYQIGSEKASPSTITVGASGYLEKKIQAIDSTIEKRQNLLEKLTQEKTKTESDLIIIMEKLKNLDQTNLKIHALNDEKALLETHLKKTNHDILTCTEAVDTSVKDKFALKRLQQTSPKKPILEVAGKTLAGTRIYGRYSHLILSRTLSRTRIMEIHNQKDEEGSKKGWEMIIGNL